MAFLFAAISAVSSAINSSTNAATSGVNAVRSEGEIARLKKMEILANSSLDSQRATQNSAHSAAARAPDQMTNSRRRDEEIARMTEEAKAHNTAQSTGSIADTNSEHYIANSVMGAATSALGIPGALGALAYGIMRKNKTADVTMQDSYGKVNYEKVKTYGTASKIYSGRGIQEDLEKKFDKPKTMSSKPPPIPNNAPWATKQQIQMQNYTQPIGNPVEQPPAYSSLMKSKVSHRAAKTIVKDGTEGVKRQQAFDRFAEVTARAEQRQALEDKHGPIRKDGSEGVRRQKAFDMQQQNAMNVQSRVAHIEQAVQLNESNAQENNAMQEGAKQMQLSQPTPAGARSPAARTTT